MGKHPAPAAFQVARVIKWSPNSTITEGTCTNVNLGLSYGVVSLNASQSICPNRIDPWGTNTSTVFGANWSGCSDFKTEGVNSVDVVNDPSTAASNPNLTLRIWWANC